MEAAGRRLRAGIGGLERRLEPVGDMQREVGKLSKSGYHSSSKFRYPSNARRSIDWNVRYSEQRRSRGIVVPQSWPRMYTHRKYHIREPVVRGATIKADSTLSSPASYGAIDLLWLFVAHLEITCAVVV